MPQPANRRIITEATLGGATLRAALGGLDPLDLERRSRQAIDASAYLPSNYVAGTSDPAAAFQTALNAAVAAGKALTIPPGRHKPSTTITVPSGARIIGASGAVIDCTNLGNQPAFKATGTAAAAVLLTATANEGTFTTPLSSASGIVAGDWVKISSNATVGAATNQPFGEIQRVRSVAGDTLTFADPLSRTYDTANDAKVEKLTQVVDIAIRDLAFEGVAASTSISYQAIVFDTARNVSVKDCTFRWIHYVSVTLMDTVFARVSNCHFADALSAGTAYGVANWWATQDVSVVNCSSLRVRHQVTCGGGTSRRGTPRRIAVSGCVASESIDAAFDAHTGCDYFSVSGCQVIGGGQDGIIAQGRAASITGNVVTGVVRHGIIIQGASVGGMHATVSGNVCHRTGSRGIYVNPDTTPTNKTWSGVAITGNDIADCGNTGIEIAQSDTTFYAEGFTVTGNTVRRPGAHGIFLRGIRDASCSGNHVFKATSGNSCIYVLSSIDVSVCNNALNGEAVSAYGVRLNTTSTNCIVNGNRIRGCTYGIGQEAASSPAVIVGNIVTAATTAYSLAGTGNVNANNL